MSTDDKSDAHRRKQGALPTLATILQRQSGHADGDARAIFTAEKAENVTAPVKSIQQVIDEKNSDNEQLKATKKTSRNESITQLSPSLSDTLNKVSHAMDTETGKAKRDGGGQAHIQVKAGVADVLQELDLNESSESTHVQMRARLINKKNAGIIFFAVILSLSVALWLISKNSLPESIVARRLLDVVDKLESYQSQHQRLPSRLGELPGFPQDAVEWPIENYDIQLVTPQLEFFFVIVSDGYMIIARHSGEEWVYSSGNALNKPSLQDVRKNLD